ncbi:MAG: hypothetical protein MJ252_05935 [archaeon]|nr:hypothetical protein [archaeon]
MSRKASNTSLSSTSNKSSEMKESDIMEKLNLKPKQNFKTILKSPMDNVFSYFNFYF